MNVIETRANTLFNVDNYGPLKSIATKKHFLLSTAELSKENWREYYNGILNILKDGIYCDYVQKYMVDIQFAEGTTIQLSIMDLYMNIVMWRLIIIAGEPIMPYHLFFEDEITADSIKDYIDKWFIDQNRTTTNNKELSNAIADTLHCFHDIDQFSAYLSNTLNLEDTVLLMEKDPEFYECLHADLEGLPIDKVKDVGMDYTNKSIRSIKKSKALLGYDHCLADAWRAREGISPKQYMEFTIGIGTKPDGRGGIFNKIISNSFINGGVTDPADYFIESSIGRISQIIKFKSVSTSGSFARIMGLNNMDSFLNPDENYDCRTKHLVPIHVKTKDHLKWLNLRWYRELPNGIERCLNANKDKHLIGKTIYLRDPCTCASAARGKGVCYKCYGKLAYSVYDAQYKMGVNIGRIASELITSKLTQKQLSVKHILEANVSEIKWSTSFYEFFEVEMDIIGLNSQLNNLKEYRMLIDPDNIDLESESDDSGIDEDSDAYEKLWLNEYITEFDILYVPSGEKFHITTESEEKLYFTNEFNGLVRKKAEPIDGNIVIPLSDIKDNPIFMLQVQNNEITLTLNRLKNLYNKVSEVHGKNISQLLQDILDTNVEGKMNISSIHYGILLMNQLRSTEDILETPDWTDPNATYQILTLNEALTNNPAVLISLSYQKISRLFYSPLTYRKHKASFMDLFFMERPQRVIRGIDEPVVKKRDPNEPYDPIIILGDPNKITASAFGEGNDGESYNMYDDE